MPKIKQSSIDELNKRLDPTSILQKIGATKIKSTSDGIRCFCPIHGSDNQRSLAVYTDNNVAFCYNTGCKVYHEGGCNLIQLYAWAKNIKFHIAAEELAKEIGLKLEYDSTTKSTGKSSRKAQSKYCHIEVAHSLNGGFRRNQMIKLSLLRDWQAKHKGQDCYRTFVQYESNNLSKLYPKDSDLSPSVIGNFPLDFDNPFDPNWDDPKAHLKNTPFSNIDSFKEGLLCCLYDAKEVIEKQLNEYDIPSNAIIPSFSGRGIHTETEKRAFGVVPMYEDELIERYKYIFYVLAEVDTEAEKVVIEWNPERDEPAKTAYPAKYQTLDSAMYSKRRLWRLANSVNTKSGLYKVNIPLSQFMKHYKDPDWFLDYAKEPKAILTFPKRVIPAVKAVNLFSYAEETYLEYISSRKEKEQKKEAKTSVKAKQAGKEEVESDKPKLPECAWRGVFADFRKIYSKTTEAPDCFLYGSLLTVIGSLLGRRVYIIYGGGRKIYPNFFSAIIGKTAKVKKSTASDIAIDDVANQVDPHLIISRGISTTQGMLELLRLPTEDELQEFSQNDSLEGEIPLKFSIYDRLKVDGRLSYEGIRLLYVEREFSKLLKKAEKDYSSDFIETLTDAFDMKERLDNHSMSNPLSAKNPCVSILTTTTLGKIERRLNMEDIEGGFANRFLYFVGERKPPKPLPPEPDQRLINNLILKLGKIIPSWDNQQFRLTDEAIKIWEDFYEELYYSEHGDVIDALLGRIDLHTVKTGLTYACLENDSPVISSEQMKVAVAVGRYLKDATIDVFSGYGQSKFKKEEEEVLNLIKRDTSGLTKSEIYSELKYGYRKIKSILETLEDANLIRKVKVQYKNERGQTREKEVYKIKMV